MTDNVRNLFAANLGPARVAFQLPDKVVWCASVIESDDGRYYMAASVRPTDRGSWVTDSVVVLASADRPEGPSPTRPTSFRPAGASTGRRHDDPQPDPPPIRQDLPSLLHGHDLHAAQAHRADHRQDRRSLQEAWDDKRIGVAMAEDPRGPWRRLDGPVIVPRPGHWDSIITSNAAPVVHADGSVTLIYKSCEMPHPGPDTPPGGKRHSGRI